MDSPDLRDDHLLATSAHYRRLIQAIVQFCGRPPAHTDQLADLRLYFTLNRPTRSYRRRCWPTPSTGSISSNSSSRRRVPWLPPYAAAILANSPSTASATTAHRWARPASVHNIPKRAALMTISLRCWGSDVLKVASNRALMKGDYGRMPVLSFG